jgi:hypothetical protein
MIKLGRQALGLTVALLNDGGLPPCIVVQHQPESIAEVEMAAPAATQLRRHFAFAFYLMPFFNDFSALPTLCHNFIQVFPRQVNGHNPYAHVHLMVSNG